MASGSDSTVGSVLLGSVLLPTEPWMRRRAFGPDQADTLPPEVLGQVEHSNRATADAAAWSWWNSYFFRHAGAGNARRPVWLGTMSHEED